ncbi:cytochrome bd oxidase small subunit CydS [Paenibacillus planticolens]
MLEFLLIMILPPIIVLASLTVVFSWGWMAKERVRGDENYGEGSGKT